MTNATVLVVDDDAEIRELLELLLTGEGYRVVGAADGEEALARLDERVDLVILDVLMPGMSGYRVCASLREKSNVPVLFLTAKSMDTDMTLGFSSGGDDYLAKPFSNAELLSRVKALIRRYHVYRGKEESAEDDYLVAGRLRVHRQFNEAYKDERELGLTELEYRMLRLMLRHRGKIFSAENLYESVWDEPYFAASANTVMVHIRKLRAKVEDDPQNPQWIRTVWGRGYRVE